MRCIPVRATVSHTLAALVAATLCLGSWPAPVRAQEAAPAGAAIASAGEEVLLRDSPGYEAAVLAPLGNGNALAVAGAAVTAADGSSWLPVLVNGQSGYVPTGYVSSAAAPPVAAEPAAIEETVASSVPGPVTEPVTEPVAEPLAAAPVPAGNAATTTEANLRAAPSIEAEVMRVLEPGTALTVNGAQENGFVPVSGNGATGWVAVELLAQGTETAPPADPALTSPEPAPLVAPDAAAAPVTDVPETAADEGRGKENRGASTGIAWPMSGGEWEVVQGYNNGTHTNRSSFAQYKYSLDWARSDGDTAGQTVFAPVSGTVEWTDRGSGGLLIDAGNGYGVALFHITLDRGLGSGDQVEQGQRIGRISGPGGDGYMSMAHIDITCWRLLPGGGHESVPFDGPNTIAGQAFPDNGGGNQHMGATVAP